MNTNRILFAETASASHSGARERRETQPRPDLTHHSPHEPTSPPPTLPRPRRAHAPSILGTPLSTHPTTTPRRLAPATTPRQPSAASAPLQPSSASWATALRQPSTASPPSDQAQRPGRPYSASIRSIDARRPRQRSCSRPRRPSSAPSVAALSPSATMLASSATALSALGDHPQRPQQLRSAPRRVFSASSATVLNAPDVLDVCAQRPSSAPVLSALAWHPLSAPAPALAPAVAFSTSPRPRHPLSRRVARRSREPDQVGQGLPLRRTS